MPSSATLRDVAKMAGVSVGTASQAINNKPNVSPETRARVLDAAVSLGYQVREAPAYIVDKPLSVIGMLVMHDLGTEVEPNVFYSHIQSGVESECRKQGISLMFSTVEVDHRKRPVEWPAMARDSRIEGLLLIGVVLDSVVDHLPKQMNVPIVLIDAYAPHLPLDSVLIENEEGAFTAVNYLIQHGHRHIGLIGWHEDAHPGLHERKKGYLRALAESGIQETYIEPSILKRDAAADATRRMLEKNPQIDALFVLNDDSTVGVVGAVKEMGRRLPQDLSIIGFDDLELGRTLTPSLTTVHVYKAWLGMVGVRRLIERACSPDQPRLVTRLTTDLIVRESVASHTSGSG